jgi:polyisoprenoid-binding protein YceI
MKRPSPPIASTLSAAASQCRSPPAESLATFGHDPVIAARDFTGEAQFEPDTLENASVHVEISASTLEVSGGANDKDKAEIEQRMHRDVLESETYPLLTFDGSNVKATPMGPRQYRVERPGS